MNHKIFLGGLACVLLACSSCSDFLTEDPKGRSLPQGFYNTDDKLQSLVYGLYEKVQQTQIFTNMLYPQWQGDDMTANPGSNKQAVAALDAFSATDNNKGVNDAWQRNYKMIEVACQLLEQENTEGPSEDLKKEAMGQAYFWRAYGYFYLVRIFGELPIITSSGLQPNTPLSSIEDVYKLIVSDLNKAEALLPTSYSGEPKSISGVDNYVTKQAVQATQTAVYMAMAGYPLNKGTEYYKMAADKALAVINGNYGFYLEPKWSQVYSIAHNYNKATILGIANSPESGSWDHDSEFTSCNRFESLGDDGGWGDSWGEIKFWKNYPDGPRKRAVYAPKITFQKGTTITKSVDWWAMEDGKPVVAEYHPMFSIFTVNCDPNNINKELIQDYDYTQANYAGMTNGARHRIIRYSELLLWYAESAARSGGDLDKAKQFLKQVHLRAVDDQSGNFTYMDGTTVNIDAMTADQVAKAAMEEHGWEVAGYWVATVTRRADELRMNQLRTNFEYRVANNPIEVAPGYKATESVNIPKEKQTWNGDHTIYLPYPGSEVEKNPNLVRK